MKFCLIGEKLSHSYSAKIHNLSGLDYSLEEVAKDRLEDFVAKCDYDGFNVTIPYKKDIIKYLDGVSDLAKKVGAVNTVVRKNGLLYGFNTDVGGLKYTLKRKNIDIKGKNVLVLGSGGASATAAALCGLENAGSVTVVGRNSEVNYTNCYNLQDTEVIINATPVGMYPNNGECIIEPKEFKKLKAAVDCIYNPFETEFLYRSAKIGAVVSGGLPMLAEQALIAQDIWLDKKHSEEDTEKLIETLKCSTLNLVLSGMPSSGKTTLGKITAELSGKEFFDVDEYIEKTFGKSAKDIILSEGETAFREKESAMVKELSAKSGAVIACGGGSVLKEENVKNLKSNGVIIFIDRNLSLLTDSGRPLSASTGINKLYEQRINTYLKSADECVKNDSDAQKVSREILKKYEIACSKRG